jgi:HK97 family phage major capsid protein
MNEQELRQFLHQQDSELKQLIKEPQDELKARMMQLEQLVTSRGAGGGSSSFFGGDGKSVGEQLVESEGFKALQKGASRSGPVAVKSFRAPQQKTVITGPWSAAPQLLPVVATPGQRRLFVRDLLPQSSTSSNMIEFAREDTITGGAGYQVPEASAKPETSFTYSLQTQPVVQLAHWLGASRQLLDDSLAFSQYIDGRMLYLLKLKEEVELLYGDNSTGHLRGLATAATPFAGTGGLIDSVGQAISALAAVDREADSCVLNVSDWWSARQQKAVGSGIYLLGSPLDGLEPSLWGLRTVATPSVPPGHFLVGQFQIGASLYDRMSATIEVSREHQDFFIKNMVAILCEERLCLIVYRSDAFIYGTTGTGS